MSKWDRESKQIRELFSGLVFFLNREVPAYSLEYLLVSFGAEVT